MRKHTRTRSDEGWTVKQNKEDEEEGGGRRRTLMAGQQG